MIQIKNISKSYKSNEVLHDLSLEIQTGEFFVIIGSSGCGKTTLMKCINKLNKIDKGEILINGKNVSEIHSKEIPKKIGYVVQEGGLFPHLTIADNIGIILGIIGEKEIDKRIDEMLKMVDLDPKQYRNLYPSQLSGGQRQRVGVARAFAADPEIILMDEPFSALDPVTKNELQNEVLRLQTQFNKTIVFVTHDMDEAIKLASRICIIKDGNIVQCDKPEEILKNPKNDYVEEFIGKNKLWSNPEFINASDIMLKDPHEIPKEFNVFQAISMMDNYNIQNIIVTDKGKLIGVVHLKDIQNKNGNDNIQKYLSQNYISAFLDTNLQKIVTNFDYSITGIIPVVDRKKVLKGYLTKGALLASLSKQFTEVELDEERCDIIA